MKLFIDHLTKRYSKDKYGLSNFSLSVNKGILGLLGPNGAGKSTLLKMIATISKPTEGSIMLNDQNIIADPNYMRQQLGYLPQDFGVYPNLNAFEFLNYIAAMKGIGGPGLKTRISFLLEGLNLIENAKRPIGSYSGGMKQRVGIAQALLNEPKVILFDEPTVGLDPEERVRFRNLISELADESIVILSSHIVSDIDTIADQVAIMKAGSLVSLDYPENIVEKVRGKVFEVNLPKSEVNTFKEGQMVVNSMRKKDEVMLRYIADKPVVNSIPVTASLEDAYLYLTKTN